MYTHAQKCTLWTSSRRIRVRECCNIPGTGNVLEKLSSGIAKLKVESCEHV